VAARQIGSRALAPQCRGCAVGQICGGGLYPHRYRAETGFANPSVYCADLYRLISHIRDRVRADLLPSAPLRAREIMLGGDVTAGFQNSLPDPASVADPAWPGQSRVTGHRMPRDGTERCEAENTGDITGP
jgi:hypothetical protein